MSSVPYLPFYPADYLADTRHLTTEQHGAYLLLLMSAWNTGGRLPNNDSKLARMAGVSLRRWRAIADDILEYWTEDGDEIVSERLVKEHQKATAKSELRSRAGKRGGKAKALKNKQSTLANAIAKPCHSPEPEPLATNVAKEKARASAPVPFPSEEVRSAFDRIWDRLPPQARRRGEGAGLRAFGRAIARGGNPIDIERAVGPWLTACDDVIERFDRWLDEDLWKEWLPKSAKPSTPDIAGEVALFAQADDPRLARRRWEKFVGGPCPGEPGCRAPPEILAEHGYGERKTG